METFVQFIMGIILKLGLPGLSLGLFIEGLGIPFPGETVMVIYGYLSYLGHYSLGWAIIISLLGAWLGSIIAFFLGRTYGSNLLYRYHKWMFLKEKHIDKTMELSKKYGPLVLILGRHLPGVRTVSSYVAGIGGMKWGSFIIYSFVGFLFWCGTWLLFGFIMADQWERIFHLFQSSLSLVMFVVLVIIVVYQFTKKKKFQTDSKR